MDNEVYEGTMTLDEEPWLRSVKKVIESNEKMAESVEEVKKSFSFTDTKSVDRMKSQLEQLEAYIEKTENKPMSFISDNDRRKLYDAKIEAGELYEALKKAGEVGKTEVFSQEQLSQIFAGNNAISDAVNNMNLFNQEVDNAQPKLSFWQALKKFIFLSDEEIKEMNDDLENSGNEAEETKEKVKEIGDASSEAEDKSKGLINVFKKMGLAVIGVRSAFTFFRKVVGTALSDNIDLSNKFNAVWHALGNAITPLLSRIANLILTAFSYLNVFVKAISGGKVDLLAKTSKSAGSTAKSLKEANKQLAGFDELQNIDDNVSGSSGAGSSGISDPFADVNMNPEWVEKIQAFGEYMREHWPAVITLLGLTWLWLDKIGALSIWGFATKVVGIGLAVAGLIKLVEDLKNFFNDPTWDIFATVLEDIGLIALGVGLAFGNTTALIVAGIILAVASAIKNFDSIKQWWAQNKDVIVAYVQQIGKGIKQLFNGEWAEGLKNIFKGAFGILDKTIFPGIYDSAKTIWKGINDLFNGNWKSGLVNIFKGLGNGIISIFNGLIRGVNAILSPARSLIVALGKVSGKNWTMSSIRIPTIPSLDIGTNYVPNDQLAMIHKGEAVVPKKFNSEEFFGGNTETAEKLDRVIDLIESIDFQPYITVKDIGQTATKYQNQQVRIMGGKV